MHRADQTIVVGDPRPGNCFAACVASALDLDLEDVPHFIEWGVAFGDSEDSGTAWWVMFVGYLFGRGFHVVEVPSIDSAEAELVFAHGMSPRGVMHQVLYLDGELWHDPHPSRAGVLSVEPHPFVIRPLPAGGHDHDPTAVIP